MNHPDYGGIQEAKQIKIDKLSDIADLNNINNLVTGKDYSIESMYISYSREIPESMSHNLNTFKSDFEKNDGQKK